MFIVTEYAALKVKFGPEPSFTSLFGVQDAKAPTCQSALLLVYALSSQIS